MDWKSYSKLTGWIDYDRPTLKNLTYKQKIAYFNKRLNIILLNPLDDIYKSISKKPNYSPILIFATSVCCALEALGKFKIGSINKNQDRFYAFISYMHNDYKKQKLNKKKYEEILWKYYRNGLAHGFTICHGGFEHNNSYFKVKTYNNKQMLIIDPGHFYKDFKQAISQYLEDLRKANPTTEQIAKIFAKIFDDVFIQGK